jgi:hypothetical protein
MKTQNFFLLIKNFLCCKGKHTILLDLFLLKVEIEDDEAAQYELDKKLFKKEAKLIEKMKRSGLWEDYTREAKEKPYIGTSVHFLHEMPWSEAKLNLNSNDWVLVE